MDDFEFLDPGRLQDDDLELVLIETRPGDPRKANVPSYVFTMRVADCEASVGEISLRVGETDLITRYAGHVGYRVRDLWRGHHFAARACRLIMPLARRHGLRVLWITCNPENVASRRTCELAGARYVETVDLPACTAMYQQGDRQKCRYQLDL